MKRIKFLMETGLFLSVMPILFVAELQHKPICIPEVKKDVVISTSCPAETTDNRHYDSVFPGLVNSKLITISY